MKKLILGLVAATALYSAELNIYTFTVKMDYNEYSTDGAFLDGDSSNFGDLNGLGLKYTYNDHYLEAEISYGKSKYEGSTWGGDKLYLTKDNVSIINAEGGIYVNRLNLFVGYRFWNRGKSDYIGDYDEQYYWPFIGVGMRNIYPYLDGEISTRLAFQYAIKPKLDAELGSGTTLDLGTTVGFKFQMDGKYDLGKNFYLTGFYRYQVWHIQRSDVGYVTIDNTKYSVVEPESYTVNQYLSLGVLYKF